MAGLGSNKQFTCDIPDCRQCFLSEEHLSPYPSRHNVDPKTSLLPVDQTPTPTTIFRKCEEAGLLQALQVENPFEETFRKATEGIRSGSNLLELPIHLNAQESLNTPQVIIPGTTSNETTSKDPPTRIVSSGPDTLSPYLNPIQPSPIVRREADTSDCKTEENDKSSSTAASTNFRSANTEKPVNPNTTSQSIGNGEESRSVQVLLRMPDGKLVQLSTLPVEPVSASRGSVPPNVPIIKVDGPPSETSDSDSSVTLQTSMSLAKMKLKQALMTNKCPAATAQSLKTSKNGIGAASSQHQQVNNEIGSQETSSDQKSSTYGDEEADVRRRKFLERNRAAAMRCREKKKTWVQELERNSSEMLRTNQHLEKEIALLRSEVAQLKTLLLAHKDCPVTKAMAKGDTTLPGFVTLPTPSKPASTTRSQLVTAAPSTVVIQPPAVRPVLILNDPRSKRRRHTSSSDSSTPSLFTQDSVISPSPFVKTALTATTPAPLIISNFVTTTPAILTPVSVSRAFILPASDRVSTLPPPAVPSSLQHWDRGENAHEKMHSRHIFSSNVIKVNPNLADRDIEIIEVKGKRNR